MKQTWPAAERNKDPILTVLRDLLPSEGTVLEVASGTGQHAEWFARHVPGLFWQPSDVDPDNLASIAARCGEAELPNLRPPLVLDVTASSFGSGFGAYAAADLVAVYCANMIHIAPWSACEGLVAGAAQLLRPQGLLVLYGPFSEGGQFSAPSNAAFDQDLRTRNPAWGVRDLEQVTALARHAGFERGPVIPMPANNLVVVFVRLGTGTQD